MFKHEPHQAGLPAGWVLFYFFNEHPLVLGAPRLIFIRFPRGIALVGTLHDQKTINSPALFQVLAFDSEGILDIFCTNYFKNRSIFLFAMREHCRYTCVPKNMTNSLCYSLSMYWILSCSYKNIYVGATWS